MNQVTTAPRPGANEPCWCGSGQKYKKCHRDKDETGASAAPPPAGSRRVRPGHVTPMRKVPPHIKLPEWHANGRVTELGWDEREVRTADEIVRMRKACRAAAVILQKAGALVRPGVTTDEIDVFVHEETVRQGGYPSPLNYRGYPKSVCTSVNEVICHGIPDDRALEDGDIINIDVTIFLEGVHGDTSATFLVGNVDEESQRLVRVTHECLMKGIEVVKPGKQVREIGRAIEHHARRNGMGTVRAFCGHGIGTRFHSGLQIPHFDDPEARTIIQPGMTFTVEPMITLGTWRHKEWDDGWTAVTADHRRTAQFEHTLLVTGDGTEILTRAD